MSAAARIEILGVPGIGEIAAGDDLSAVLADALAAAAMGPLPGDVVVVSSKVVSKAEGRAVAATTRDAAIVGQTVRVVAERATGRGLARVVQSRSGPVLAAAGVDASNVPPGTVLLLPADPDASARGLRARLQARTGVRLGVVVTDTAGRPWRDGQTDLAVGVAGLAPVEDLRGGTDTFGAPLEVTVRALADELAAAADLVKGKLTKVPAAIVRGLAGLVTADDGPGAAALLRTGPGDWFAHGHVEAVRSALGAPPGTPGVDPQPLPLDGVTGRLDRAVAVATAGSGLGPAHCSAVTADGEGARVEVSAASAAPDAVLAAGALAQRVVTAAWAERLAAHATPVARVDGVPAVRISARPLP